MQTAHGTVKHSCITDDMRADNLTDEQVNAMVIAFTCGDCNVLAGAIERAYPETFEVVVNWRYFENEPHESFWNHALVRNKVTGELVDIEGVYTNADDYAARGQFGSEYMEIALPEETNYSLELQEDMRGRNDFEHLYEFPVEVALDYMRLKGWIG